MSNSPITRERVFDKNGTPISGAKRYYYEGGSSTPLAVYSDRARSSAITQPVTANSHGYLQEVFLTPEVPYKIVTKDADGNTLETVDDAYSVVTSDDNLLTRIKQIASNPIDYGAVGDGASDESSYVQSAIDYVNANGGGVVNLLGLVYRCDSTLTLYSNVKLVGPGTLDFTNCADDEYILLAGTLGTGYNLSSNAAYRASAVVASSSGISAGDLVRIVSAESVAGSVTSGELVEVLSVSGTTHNLRSPLLDNYDTADTAQIAEVTPVSDVVIEDITILASTSPGGSNVAVVRATRCKNLQMKRVRITGISSAGEGVALSECFNTLIEGCTIGNTAGAAGVGVEVRSASRNTKVNGCRLAGLATGVTSPSSSSDSGGAHNVRVHHCSFDGVTTPWAFHECTTAVSARWNHTSQGTTFDFRPADGVMENNVLGDDGTVTVNLTAGTPNHGDRHWSVSCSHNQFMSGAAITSSLATFTNIGGTLRRLKIRDNEAAVGTGLDINVVFDTALAATVDCVDVSRNHAYAGYVDVNNTSSTPVISKVIIDGNVFEDSDRSGAIVECSYEAYGAGRAYVRRNVIDGNGSSPTRGIYVGGGDVVEIRNNEIAGIGTSSSWGIYAESLADNGRITCDGNTVDATDGGILLNCDAIVEGLSLCGNTVVNGATEHALQVSANDGSTCFNVSNNLVSCAPGSGKHSLYVSGFVDGLTIAGNTFTRVSDDNDSNVHLDATTSGDITNVVLSGNNLANGTYGVEFTNGDGLCWWAGGATFSMATDEFLGAVGRSLLSSTSVESSAATGMGETAFDNYSFDIPANLLQVGDVLRFRSFGYLDTATGGGNIQLRQYLDSSFIMSDQHTVAQGNWVAYVDLHVETDSASGSCLLVYRSELGTSTNGPTTSGGTTIDTAQDLTSQWRVNFTAAGNSITCRGASLELLRPGT